MKKTTRRILSLALCLMLMLSIPLSASAVSTSVSWTDSSGTHYLYLNGTETTRAFKYPSADTVTHYYGDSEYVYYTGGDSVTATWNYWAITTASYIESCMINLKMVNSRTGKSTAGSSAYKILYTTTAAGTYTVGALFPYMTGTSRVTDEASTIDSVVSPYASTTGSFYGPLSTGTVTNDYLYKTS